MEGKRHDAAVMLTERKKMFVSLSSTHSNFPMVVSHFRVRHRRTKAKEKGSFKGKQKCQPFIENQENPYPSPFPPARPIRSNPSASVDDHHVVVIASQPNLSGSLLAAVPVPLASVLSQSIRGPICSCYNQSATLSYTVGIHWAPSTSCCNSASVCGPSSPRNGLLAGDRYALGRCIHHCAVLALLVLLFYVVY